MPKATVEDVKKRMEGALSAFHHDLKGLRTGRASVSMLDSVRVEAYGDKMPLTQLATVSAPEARLINVQVWDNSLAHAVEKAIVASGLGLNPITEGAVLRIPIPDLSEDRRKELVKVAHQYAEKAKIAMRNVRRDGMDALKKLEKDKKISEDEHRDRSDEIQKIIESYSKKIDEALALKEKDIMEV